MGIDARMLLKVNGEYTSQQTLELARHTFECFGDDVLWVDQYGDKDRKHCIIKINKYEQDGDTIFPQNNETFLEVRLWGRYYGKGYERGDLSSYIMLAEFFEHQIPKVEVWYGGDSSGVEVYLFDKATRDDLFFYFCINGHSPYQDYFDHEKDGEVCKLCKIPMTRYGWGANYRAWYCKGCGTRVQDVKGIKKYLNKWDKDI